MSSFALGAAVLGEEVTLQFTRVLGNAATGIAEAALATFAVNRSLPLLALGGTSADIAKAGADATVALLGRSAGARRLAPGALRRREHRSLRRARTARPTVEVAVAFVDLVESTQLTQTLDGPELAGALGDFERVASDAVVEAGGRVVKRIGDAVMFVASDVAGGVRRRARHRRGGRRAPDADRRAAVAFGDVLPARRRLLRHRRQPRGARGAARRSGHRRRRRRRARRARSRRSCR